MSLDSSNEAKIVTSNITFSFLAVIDDRDHGLLLSKLTYIPWLFPHTLRRFTYVMTNGMTDNLTIDQQANILMILIIGPSYQKFDGGGADDERIWCQSPICAASIVVPHAFVIKPSILKGGDEVTALVANRFPWLTISFMYYDVSITFVWLTL